MPTAVLRVAGSGTTRVAQTMAGEDTRDAAGAATPILKLRPQWATLGQARRDATGHIFDAVPEKLSVPGFPFEEVFAS